jgi:PASTA domain
VNWETQIGGDDMLPRQVAAASNTSTLSHSDFVLVLAITVGLILASGLVVVIGRKVLSPSSNSTAATDDAQQTGDGGPSATLIRSWLAIALAGGLVLFCAVAFAIDDQSLRSTLIGGLVASAGAAVAFYFSSKSSDQARSDILSAALGTVEVPNLVGMTVAQAKGAMATSSLSLRIDPSTAADTATVKSQLPPANSSARSGTTVSITAA